MSADTITKPTAYLYQQVADPQIRRAIEEAQRVLEIVFDRLIDAEDEINDLNTRIEELERG